MNTKPLLAMDRPFQLGQTIYIMTVSEGIKSFPTSAETHELQNFFYDGQFQWTISRKGSGMETSLNRYAESPSDAYRVMVNRATDELQNHLHNHAESLAIYARRLTEFYESNGK